MGVFRRPAWRAYYRKRRAVFGTSDDVNVNVGVASLTVSTFQAAVSYDVTVAANTAALTLATQAASVSYDVDVGVSTAALTLSTFTADVSYDVDVDVGTASLTLTAFNPTVEVGGDVNVGVGQVSLGLTTFQASITATDAVESVVQSAGGADPDRFTFRNTKQLNDDEAIQEVIRKFLEVA